MAEISQIPTGALADLECVAPEDQIKLVELVEVVPYQGFNAWQIIQRAEGRKQYINLDSQMIPNEAHPEYGRCIYLKARIEWAAGDPARPLNGKSVMFYPVADPANLSCRGNQRGGFGAEDGAGNDIVQTDAEGWTEVVCFYFSINGGDKFELCVTCETNELKTGAYTVWRKLWYEIDTMKKRGGGRLDMDHAQLPPLLEPCFIELVAEGTDNEPDNIWNLQTTELHDFANKCYGAGMSPYQCHEAAVDHQADKIEQPAPVIFEMTAPVYIDGTAREFWVYDGATGWNQKAEYRDGNEWKALDKSKVSLVGSDPVEKQMKIDLSSFTITPTPANPLKVRLKYLLADEFTGDGSNKPHALIAMGYWLDTHTEAEDKKRSVGTMVHELGHLLGMVPSTSSTYLHTPTGSHCSDANCVMYATNTSTRGRAFCGICTEILKRLDFATVKANFMHSKGAGA